MRVIELTPFKDKQILYLDFTNLYAIQANKYLEDSKEVINQQPKGSVLLLVNAADIQVLDNILGAVINYVTNVLNEYLTFCSGFEITCAIIPPKKLGNGFLTSIGALKNNRVATFDDVLKAKEWLEELK